MKTSTSPLAGPIVLPTLSFEPGAFNDEILAIVGSHKLGWSGENHLQLVEALIERLRDEDGDPIELTEEQRERMRLIFRPVEETQRKVFNDTITELGFKLDEATDRAFLLLMNQAQVADYLAKTNKPGTNDKFIIKEKKRGIKKGMFEDLIGASTTGAQTSADEDEQAVTEEAEEEVIPPQPAKIVAPKSGAIKPGTRK